MKNLKMILEEILPFYFLLMVFALIFTNHEPTTFELYIVYAYAFGVSIFNNRLYKNNNALVTWAENAVVSMEAVEESNKRLRDKIEMLSKKNGDDSK